MQAEGITVWGGLWYEGLIGPFFFETTVTGQNYLSMLKDHFYPQFRRLPCKGSFLFMQDGASAHYAGNVQYSLDNSMKDAPQTVVPATLALRTFPLATFAP
jgi:hypothetical protein